MDATDAPALPTSPEALRERVSSTTHELANALTHGLGALAALAGGAVLVTLAALHGDGWQLVGAIVFAACLLLLYLASTLYHAAERPQLKTRLKVLDHCAIYLLIAGSYTPFTLGVLYGPWGWSLFGLVWGLAAAGVLLKAVGGIRYPVLSTLLYLGMGWLALIAIRPLWLHLPLPGLLWLAAGGVAYTVGVAFFAADTRVRYAHFVWHLFVMAGTACHFVAVYRYAA